MFSVCCDRSCAARPWLSLSDEVGFTYRRRDAQQHGRTACNAPAFIQAEQQHNSFQLLFGRTATVWIINTRVDAKWGSLTLRQACYRENPGSAMCVQNLNDSRGFAIRITYRISLRSSSLWEPRHPLLKVVSKLVFFTRGQTRQCHVM